ncbi:MAG: hypothetical protein R8K54_08325 [Mariprofundaceae bacterium]
MNKSDLAILPPELAVCSISSREIVLPLQGAIEAVNFLESNGIEIGGWEGWVKTCDGRVGHTNTVRGTESLETLTLQEAAEFCRETMLQDAEDWKTENPTPTDELHFCITVCR